MGLLMIAALIIINVLALAGGVFPDYALHF